VVDDAVEEVWIWTRASQKTLSGIDMVLMLAIKLRNRTSKCSMVICCARSTRKAGKFSALIYVVSMDPFGPLAKRLGFLLRQQETLQSHPGILSLHMSKRYSTY
jgi:hypothetical protein